MRICIVVMNTSVKLRESCANDGLSSGNAVTDLPRHPKKYGGYVPASCLRED